MKKEITYKPIQLWIAWSLIVYGAFAFGLWEPDPIHWSNTSRSLCVFFGPFIGLTILAHGTGGMTNEKINRFIKWVAVWSLIVFAAFAFVNWGADPKLWSGSERGLCMFFGPIMGCGVFIQHLSDLGDEKSYTL